MNRSGMVAMLAFGLFWSALVGVFDFVVFRGIWRQARTSGFATTTGTVTHSAVTRHRGSKGGTTYGVKIHYDYAVGGVAFTGTNYRHGAFSSTSDSGWATAAVARHAPGTVVPVHYDPACPGDAVLATGLMGSDLFVLLFLTPFNAAMVGLIGVPVVSLHRLRRWRETGGLPWSEDGRRIRLRLPHVSAWLAGLVTLGGGGFVCIFLVGLPTRFSPGLGTIQLVWAALIALAVAAVWHTRRRLLARGTDLVIDVAGQTVSLPGTRKRQTPQTFPFSAVANVTLEPVVRRGNKGRARHCHIVQLHVQGRAEKLAEWEDRWRAEALEAWLRQRLPLGEPAAPPRKSSVA